MRTKKEKLILFKLILILYKIGRIFWFLPPIIWTLKIDFGFCLFLQEIQAKDLISELKKDLISKSENELPQLINGYWYETYSPILLSENFSSKPFKLRIEHLKRTISRLKTEINLDNQ